MLNSEFSKAFRRHRVATRARSLRVWCQMWGFDIANMSRIETGKAPAPERREVLERYAEALCLKPGSPEYREFFDLAAADRGILPDDIANDDLIRLFLPRAFQQLREHAQRLRLQAPLSPA